MVECFDYCEKHNSYGRLYDAIRHWLRNEDPINETDED